MDWIIALFGMLQMVLGALPRECINFEGHRHFQLNDTRLQELKRTDGIRSLFHCEERDKNEFRLLIDRPVSVRVHRTANSHVLTVKCTVSVRFRLKPLVDHLTWKFEAGTCARTTYSLF